MAWDTTKATGDLITATEWNLHVTDQKARLPLAGGALTGDVTITTGKTIDGIDISMLRTISVLIPSATVSLDPTLGAIFTLVPGNALQINATSVPSGQVIYIIITTSGASSYIVTFGTNFKSTGTLATGVTTDKVFVVTFISNGTNFNEVSRTTAM